MRRPPIAAALVATMLFVAGLSGCGSSTPVAVPLHAAPEPAVSPPATADLPGTIVAEAGAPEGVAITSSGIVGVNVRQPDGLVLFPIADPKQRRFVALSGTARHLTLGTPAGPFLVPQESDNLFVQVDPATGRVLSTVKVGHHPHDAIAVGRGRYFVADELANTIHIVADGHVLRVVGAPLQPGGMAANPAGTRALVVGVRGRRISEYTAAGILLGSANAGAGPTHAATGSDGLYWVADTNGGAILGYRMTSDGPHQVATIPVGLKPYGLAYDPVRQTLWVTLTGTDQLLGLHLHGDKVASRTTYRTVRQPNTVAVDPASGELVVTGSTSPGELQLLG